MKDKHATPAQATPGSLSAGVPSETVNKEVVEKMRGLLEDIPCCCHDEYGRFLRTCERCECLSALPQLVSEKAVEGKKHECQYDADGSPCRICGKTVAQQAAIAGDHPSSVSPSRILRPTMRLRWATAPGAIMCRLEQLWEDAFESNEEWRLVPTVTIQGQNASSAVKPQ